MFATVAAAVLAKIGPLVVAASGVKRRLGGKVPSLGAIAALSAAIGIGLGAMVLMQQAAARKSAGERGRTVAETTTALAKASLIAENAALKAAVKLRDDAVAARDLEIARLENNLEHFETQQKEIRDVSTSGKGRTIVIPPGDPWLVRHRPFGDARGVR